MALIGARFDEDSGNPGAAAMQNQTFQQRSAEDWLVCSGGQVYQRGLDNFRHQLILYAPRGRVIVAANLDIAVRGSRLLSQSVRPN
jgi:hypothetical protein